MKNQYELTEKKDKNYQLQSNYIKADEDESEIVSDVPFVGYVGQDDKGNVYRAGWPSRNLTLIVY